MYNKPIDSNLACDNKISLTFDIGKGQLNIYTELVQHSIQDKFHNTTLTIKQKLTKFQGMPNPKGITDYRSFLTGVYHKKSFRTGRKIGP